MKFQQLGMEGHPQIKAAALKLLEAAQDAMPPGADFSACIAAAMMAARNAGAVLTGGFTGREEVELSASLLVSLTLGLAERLHAQPELAVIDRAAMRDAAFEKIVSTATVALATIPEDVNVTIPPPADAQPRKEAS